MVRKCAFILPFVALAFLFQTLLPFYATYQLPKQASGMSSIFGDKVLICTAEGFRFVSLKDIEQGNTPAQHKQYACAVCYVSANHLAIESPVIGIDNPASTASATPLPTPNAVVRASAWHAFLTRAPPVSFTA